MPFRSIAFDVADGVATLTLDRPDALNAIDRSMAQELREAACRCDQDPGVRAVLVTGAGRVFSVGGDLRSFAAAGDSGVAAELKEVTLHLHAAVSHLVRMRAPVVVAVNGTAAGGAVSLAIAGDLVLAAESATFTMAYTAAGLSPDGSATFCLPRLIGLRRTQELIFTNRRLSAAEAHAWGLVTRVVADDRLALEAATLARTLAAGPTSAFATAKRLLASSFSATLETQMELEGRGIAEAAVGADGREGIDAFLTKRAAHFTGT
jgi:2-(1,2-epoxy-1,2-dihydrophenyl)acetyl-CoA isomerase